MAFSLYLVDDHKIVREGLKKILSEHNDITIIGETDNAVDAIREITTLVPDVVLMDISLAEMNGLEASGVILNKNNNIKILILTMYEDKGFYEKARKIGVNGYILKNSSGTELMNAIRTVVAGKLYFKYEPMELTDDDSDGNLYLFEELSQREFMVVKSIINGLTNNEMAQNLNVSVKTIELERKKILNKLDCKNTTELIKKAVKAGID